MQEHWKTIELWLKTHAKDVFDGLNPPASTQQISDAEAALGVRFPPECIASFRIHNGQSFDSPWLFDAWEFMSLERIVDEWCVWKELLDAEDFKDCRSDASGVTVEDWWNPGWIPLTYNGAGDHDSLDLHPGPKGRSGQIIKMWHDDSERTLVASSYGEWIAGWAADMESGRCRYSEEFGGIIRGDE